MRLKSKALLTREGRDAQRERLIDCAETAIAAEGLAGLRARALAECAGCSVGAIYNLVADLDELTLLVSQRTMADLGDRLDAAVPPEASSADPFDRFAAWALAYCTFARENRNRWRALFEFRLTRGQDLPAWFAADQMQMFERLEAQLKASFPRLDPQTCRSRARTLFSAVHGIVSLGLEEKLAAMPIAALEREIAAFVRAYLVGLGTTR